MPLARPGKVSHMCKATDASAEIGSVIVRRVWVWPTHRDRSTEDLDDTASNTAASRAIERTVGQSRLAVDRAAKPDELGQSRSTALPGRSYDALTCQDSLVIREKSVHIEGNVLSHKTVELLRCPSINSSCKHVVTCVQSLHGEPCADCHDSKCRRSSCSRQAAHPPSDAQSVPA